MLPLLSLGGLAVAVTPLVYLIVRTNEAGWSAITDTLTRPSILPLVRASLQLTATVSIACIVLGVAAAWLVTRTRFPGRRICAVLIALPLAIPSYVAAFAWRSAFPHFSGFWAAATVLTLCSYPYVYLPAAAALRSLDPAMQEVSRSLGRGPWRTFISLTVPQLRPAIAAGGLLVALYVLSDFGAVAILRFTTFTRAIFTALDLGFDRTTAVVLSTVLVSITTVLVVLETSTRGRARYTKIGSGTPRRLRRARLSLPGKVFTVAFLSCLLALALGLPAGSLTYWVIQGVERSVAWAELWSAVLGSLAVSGLGAAVTVLLALPIGLLTARRHGFLARTIEQLTWLSHALPGVVVGLSLVFFGINIVYPLYQTTTLLAFGYAVLFLPLAVGAIRTAVLQAPPQLEEVARSLGHTPLSVFARVTMPLTAPGMGAAIILVFLTCVKELPVTLLLRPTGLDTLATKLWSETSISAYSAAAPYAAALVILAAIPTYVLGVRLGTLTEDET